MSSSIMMGALLGGFSANTFSFLTTLIGQVFVYVVLFLLGLFQLGFIQVDNANNHDHLDKTFRRNRYGLATQHDLSRYGIFWGTRPIFVALWTRSDKTNPGSPSSPADSVCLIASKSTIGSLFTKSTATLGVGTGFTHEYAYVTFKGCSKNYPEPFINSIRTIKTKLETREAQFKIVNDIIRQVRDSPNHSCACCIYGTPGSGKSTIAAIVAAELHGRLTDANILAYTDCLEGCFKTSDPSISTPMVFRVDEIDTIVDDMLKHVVSLSKIDVSDAKNYESVFAKERLSEYYPLKKDWTAFLDRVAEGFYPNTVFIFTTNRDIAEYDEKDPALFRNGRFVIRTCLN
ncbi:MAG: AAA family ATPase [Desulfosporosinus sp.]|nr:AAA family ATPase [Desulfosporosinus sp.]